MAIDLPHIGCIFDSWGTECECADCDDFRTVTFAFVLAQGEHRETVTLVLCQEHFMEFVGEFAFERKGEIESIEEAA